MHNYLNYFVTPRLNLSLIPKHRKHTLSATNTHTHTFLYLAAAGGAVRWKIIHLSINSSLLSWFLLPSVHLCVSIDPSVFSLSSSRLISTSPLTLDWGRLIRWCAFSAISPATPWWSSAVRGWSPVLCPTLRRSRPLPTGRVGRHTDAQKCFS